MGKCLDNFKMIDFGEGIYKIIDKRNIIANFGGRIHNIILNIDYTENILIRNERIIGILAHAMEFLLISQKLIQIVQLVK